MFWNDTKMLLESTQSKFYGIVNNSQLKIMAYMESTFGKLYTSRNTKMKCYWKKLIIWHLEKAIETFGKMGYNERYILK